jgi:hypothetical protein
MRPYAGTGLAIIHTISATDGVHPSSGCELVFTLAIFEKLTGLG